MATRDKDMDRGGGGGGGASGIGEGGEDVYMGRVGWAARIENRGVVVKTFDMSIAIWFCEIIAKLGGLVHPHSWQPTLKFSDAGVPCGPRAGVKLGGGDLIH
eukprot:750600-Hanusia_phi.AAC.3